MCLAIPSRVLVLLGGEGMDRRARVDVDGVQTEISLAVLPEIQVGDYVLVHVGFAIAKVEASEAERILREIRELGGEEEMATKST